MSNTAEIYKFPAPVTPFNPPRGKVKFDPLTIPVPEWLDSVSWREWVAYRQQSGKAIKTELTVSRNTSAAVDPEPVTNESENHEMTEQHNPAMPFGGVSGGGWL
ncbi:hypothetical protein F3R34_21155 [Salmonella enterica subsp. enterica]|nr:hypothetical protein [Salmonella enterica subsp. enterica]